MFRDIAKCFLDSKMFVAPPIAETETERAFQNHIYNERLPYTIHTYIHTYSTFIHTVNTYIYNHWTCERMLRSSIESKMIQITYIYCTCIHTYSNTHIHIHTYMYIFIQPFASTLRN